MLWCQEMCFSSKELPDKIPLKKDYSRCAQESELPGNQKPKTVGVGAYTIKQTENGHPLS